MGELPAALDHPLLEALDALYHLVMKEPRQPLNQLAEEAVLQWTRVLDGQDILQPRLERRGYAPSAFHFGMESRADNRLDDCGLAAGHEGLAGALRERLETLGERLEAYFQHSGYRSSSDQCDLMMVELSRLSRFLNTWAREGEDWNRRPRGERHRADEDEVDLYAPFAPRNFLAEVRWQLAYWEPYCNAAVVAWEENQLDYFNRALKELRLALERSPGERARALPPPGFPLRRRGRPRQKISVFEPEQRPLRSRSVFWVRFNQLLERFQEPAAFPDGLLDAVTVEVRHFIRMATDNRFMLASIPGFLERGRAGVPVIRGRPTAHPFLLDAPGLFKKAVLFHNNTYTVAGGGLDLMYLQLRQLERFARFGRWGGRFRSLRGPLEAGLIAWDENRWDAFTEGLLQLAIVLRRQEESG